MTLSVDCIGLARLMEETSQLIILDVLPPEHYAAIHIPGALNACIYETAFLDKVAELIPDRSSAIVVYGTSRRSRASACATGKLERQGYSNVRELAGGLESWLAAGLPVEPKHASFPPQPALVDRRYRIDPDRSSVLWTGRNLTGSHTGRIAVEGGELTIDQGELAGGVIILDMTRITNADLEKHSEYYNLLIAHLVSEDFFEVSRYPKAEANLKGWRPIAGATPGTPNYSVDADLTIKGITHPVQFPAWIAPQQDSSIKGQASFDIDRTAWNVMYGSGKFFESLGMHLVNDTVTLELFITAV